MTINARLGWGMADSLWVHGMERGESLLLLIISISGPNDIFRYNRATMKTHLKNEDSYAVVVFDGISPFHLSVPCILFKNGGKNNKVPDFKVKLCAVGPQRS
jgi:hypothetical protein